MISEAYVFADHESRDADVYAKLKYEISLRWIKKIRGSKSSDRTNLLVNIGCGGGVFNRMAIESGYRVIACEPDAAAFNLASKYQHQNLQIVFGDISVIPRNEQADVIVMHDVLEHIDEEYKTLKEVSSLLSEDGLLVLSVPAFVQLYGFHDQQSGHYRRYSKTSLRRALRFFFKISKIRYFGFFALPAVVVYSRLFRKPYPHFSHSKATFWERTLSSLLRLESRIGSPLGTSVIVCAVKKQFKDF